MSDLSLTIPENLNIECNKRATAMEMYPTTVTETHPMTEAGYPHLLINGEPIILMLLKLISK